MYQFRAESYGDAVAVFCRWMLYGIVQHGTYEIREDETREGYWIAEKL